MKSPAVILRRYLLEALRLKVHLETTKKPERRRAFERAADRLEECLVAGTRKKGAPKKPAGPRPPEG